MTTSQLTPVKAAEHFGVSLRTVRRWIATGKVRIVRPTPGRKILVVIDD